MANVKTAVSIRESLHKEADELARRMKVPRSRIFSMALEDFLRRHENRQLLKEINEAYLDERDSSEGPRLRAMRRRHRKIVEGEW